MLIKLKYRDIKEMMNWCEKYGENYADGADLLGKQVNGYGLGYFTPSQANWCYRLELVNYKGEAYEVITVFSEVKAFYPLNIPEVPTD